jgi:pyrroline-5-carboxylate reductase
MTARAHKIGMLGAGNMAGALIRGLLAAKTVALENLRASDPREDRLRELADAHGIETTPFNDALVDWADVVVVAVKPQVLPSVLEGVGSKLSGKLLVSIAAGVTTASLAALTAPGTRIIRTMPNTAAIALSAATAIAAGPNATASDLELARELFNAVGDSVTVGESLLDAVTGLSGSGPAYVMLFIEGLADGGVKAGLPRDVAQKLAAQTVYGAAKLLVEQGEHPARLKDMVTSPGGTTISGLAELERVGVRHACISAVDAATRRSLELGRAAAKK